MTDKQNIQKAFVCGWPIKHSRSPLIHSHWLKELELEGSYEKISVTSEDFAQFLNSLKENGFAGGNITIPHKEHALELVDDLDDAAKKIGAINTIWFEGDRLIGSNTDWIGFASNLDQYVQGWDNKEKIKKPALVLGAGGAARGIVYALLQRGFQKILIANRTYEKSIKLAEDFGPKLKAIPMGDLENIPSDLSLLINTTSLGMSGHQSISPTIVEMISNLGLETIVTDIVYIPLKTEFLKCAEDRGLSVVDGLGMLLHQAAPGFEKWFKKFPTVSQELRNLVIADMEKSE